MKHRNYRSGTLVERKDSGKRFRGTTIRSSYGEVIDGVPNTLSVHIILSETRRVSPNRKTSTKQDGKVRQQSESSPKLSA